MTIAPLDLILLLGSAQGIILATVLWVNPKGQRLSNRLLAVLIGLLALISLSMSIPIWNRWVGRALDLLPWVMAMPLGPLVYFYAKSVLDPAFRLGRREWVLLGPVVLDWVAPMLGWVFLAGVWLHVLDPQTKPAWQQAAATYNVYIDIPRWLSMLVYLIGVNRLLSRETVVHNQLAARNWLRQVLRAILAFQVIWLIHLVPYNTPAWRGPLLDKVGWYPVYIPITILIYWLGLRGYFWSRTSHDAPRPTGAVLTPDTVAQVIAALTKAMAVDRLFLDPELTVDKLGRHCQLPPKLISAVLNQHMHKNFNGFVNTYRIDDVKARLTDPANAHLTLTGIAFESGFNSPATFQRAFKQQVGLAPGEFMAEKAKKTAQIQI